MENELRYYYGFNKYEKLLNLLKQQKELIYEGCFYELTVQYDHPMSDKSFYHTSVDGRFRVRVSKSVDTNLSKSKISWKKRTPNTSEGLINSEEEIELNFQYDELDNLIFLIENVIQMKKVESYERYRNIFSNEDIEIVVDKYPFAIALEIENKSKSRNPEDTILYWVNKLNLKLENAYRLSWDDKYSELCAIQNITPTKNVTFNQTMPSLFND